MHAFNLSVLPRRRGSALITIILLTSVLLLLAASIISWSLHERRMNIRASYWLEARNAAEAVAEYGFSQLYTQFLTQATPPTFDPSKTNKLVLPPASFFTGSKVDYASLEVIGGPIQRIPSDGSLYLVDPNDPNNASDPLKGQYVFQTVVEVLAKASVKPTGGGQPVTAYVSQTISVRGAPLFAHAFFYSNNDMEIFPGPEMHVYGPVHVNGNLFASQQGSSGGLNFHGPVSCSGNIYHAWGGSANAAAGTDSEKLGDNPVKFLTASGALADMKNSTTLKWCDSTMGASADLFSSGLYIDNKKAALDQLTPLLSSSFAQYASNTWGGNVQTSSMGVAAYNPVSSGGVVGKDGSDKPIYAGTETADALGYGPRAMIEPPATVAAADTYKEAKQECEKQKIANKASLYIQVTVTPSATAGDPDSYTVQAYGWPEDKGTGPNGGKAVTLPSGLVSFVPGKATDVTVSSTKTGGKYTVNYNTYTGTGTASGGTYTPRKITTKTEYLTAVPSGMTAGQSNNKITNSGLYDQRQLAPINLVQIDSAKLRAALTDTANDTLNATTSITKTSDGTLWGAGIKNGYDNEAAGATTGWNGAIYVEVKTSDGSATQTSVAMANGVVAKNSSLVPKVNEVGGLAVATNAPMYIVGNFNSDGSVSTNSATTPDDGNTGALGTTDSKQSPVSLAADAITILSPNYFGAPGANGSSIPSANTDTSKSAYKSYSTLMPAVSGNMEVAAAFITGLVSTSSAANSGGAHNLPRFLENWNPKPQYKVSIRGSFVSMYKSKVATGPFKGKVYGAPARDWGFDVTFKNGHYPPLTPKVISFRRVDFTDLGAAKYNSERHTLWPTTYP